ncbi:MAG: hypothetical protein R3B70_26115 [Polyangiaceae bacterium]
MNRIARTCLFFALALAPVASFAADTVVKPGEKASIYRNTSPDKRKTVSVEVTCQGAAAVPSPEDPEVTTFLAGVVYTTKAPAFGQHKCVVSNGDGTPETCELVVEPGASVVLEAYSDNKKDKGCSYSVMEL